MMKSVTDGVEVVATSAQASRLAIPPFLVIDAVEHYFDEHGLGEGPVEWQRIGTGHSNVTFRMRRGSRDFVLRRGPRPPHPPSTHDMVREARLQQLVRAAGAPVPRVLAVCADTSVLDVPFYIMEYLDGTVITDKVPAQFDGPDDRRAVSLSAVDALVGLHRIDVSAGPLARLGRPDGYLQRQVDRFSSLWEQNTRREVPAVAAVGRWLAEHVPQSQAASIVHGDYRIGNLMYFPDHPVRVTAILDWEMATIGDPLADLGYLTATYAVPGDMPTPMDLTTVTALPGFPSREELIDRYQECMHFDLGTLPWYQALALWKAAIFCEAMYTRWLDGERPDDTTFAPTLAEGVPTLVEVAKSLAGLA